MKMVVEVDGACTKPSMYFKGPCGTHKACSEACSRENLPVGICDFFKCKCEKPC
ncbi:hypothetical protein SOVF_117300 isoform B [Spinacia oleracea]|nr:hypothetical protein SOVF_117300 isoform B [Spinacia oleracea]